MIANIRFYFVNIFVLLIFSGLGAVEFFLPILREHDLHYESIVYLHSDIQHNDEFLPIDNFQKLRGVLYLEACEDLKFPINMQFTLKDAEFTVDHNHHLVSYTVDAPGTLVEANELRLFRDRSIPFSIIEEPSFILFPDDFKQRYGDLKLFRYPIFASWLGEDLKMLFTIASRPIRVGEGFQQIYEKNIENPYQVIKSVVIQEITAEHVIVEITTLIERQKISLSGEDKAVVSGESFARWVINRADGLLFNIKEKGSFQQTIQLNDEDASRNYVFEKQVVITSKD